MNISFENGIQVCKNEAYLIQNEMKGKEVLENCVKKAVKLKYIRNSEN